MNSLPPNTFKQALASGRPLIGLWCNFAHLATVECVAQSGFDWLLLDMEHTQSNLDTISSQLLALRGTPSAAVVRAPSNDMAFIKRLLDAGTTNLMVPNIRSAAEALDAVSYTRFAPQGLRGVAGSTRGGGYTRYKDYMARANDEIALVLQIESREALDELDAICRVPGVDAVFIGPADLAASLGYRGQVAHPEVQAAISKAIAIGKAAGKAVGILTVDGKGEPYLAQGATMVGVGTDMHLLIAAADALAARFKAVVS
ncbi:4-hydroxy-2-oxoheptanedioate aldolase [Rhodoferax sp. OV413]|uniref:HpcH/HpaI aldolase family protein n=1 Tax=Rhodoferax sp. OV413 TaxID=1855285 RepID=UPI00088C8505|nr:HpcH/HpaI aldolase/citrate lyase family protein [Rhodoferax sp. OV413]SDP38703.1 4-hydroxy-2-oxoheptanedioate aldolase [Rhodoferax sp. OV413]